MTITIQQEVDPDMTIAQIFETFPGKMSKLAEIMTSYGLHCVGCHANTMETLREGMLVHGFEKEKLGMLIKDLNKIVSSKEDVIAEVSISKKAADKVKKLLKEENKENYGLRLKVVDGGCAAWSYDLSFDEVGDVDDVVVNKHGVKVFIDKDSFKLIKGSEIDFTDGLQGSGFKINNPNVKKSCGCGNSFA
jgi:iron-sulfur cluster assembly protein